MRKISSLLVSSALLVASLITLSTPSASAETTLITCTDLVTQKTIILKVNQKSCKPLHAAATWRIQQSDTTAHSGAGYASLRTCTSKRTQFNYQLLKTECAKHQNTIDYWRIVTSLEIPIITTASARGYDSAAFALAATTQNIDAPIAYYLITNIKTGQINKVSPNNLGQLSLSNLSPLTSYTFTIAAVSVDGTSPSSSITPAITTGAVPVVASTSPVVLTCANGGACVVGDAGPGGGTVFFVATTPFVCGPARATTCTYLEAAPSGWNTGDDPQRAWSASYNNNTVDNASSPETATATAIGWGYWNTLAIILQGNTDTATSAAALADSHTVTVSGVLYDDWFLPSQDELNQMCTWASNPTDCPVGVGGGAPGDTGVGAKGFSLSHYWSSTEGSLDRAYKQQFGGSGDVTNTKQTAWLVRPVRAF